MSDWDRNAVRWGQGTAQARGATVDQGLRSYMLGVYNHMIVGLVLTGVAAFVTNYLAVAHGGADVAANMGRIPLTSFGVAIYGSPLRYVVMLAPLAFVFFFSFRINQMSASSARALFYAFAAVMGLSLSSILLVYTGASIYRAFFITAAAFGGLSLYGYTTKRDLSPMGSFLIMGVFGLIIVGAGEHVRPVVGPAARHLRLGRPDLLGSHRLRHAGDQGDVLAGRRLRGDDEEVGQRGADALPRLHQHLHRVDPAHRPAQQLGALGATHEKPRFAGAFLLRVSS